MSMTDEQIIEAARNAYCMGSDNDIEIDDEPALSHADSGCWVQAWVWVPAPEAPETEHDPATCPADAGGPCTCL